MPTIVKCPHCQKDVAWIEANSFRPFCSKNCQLIDLGEWADEKKAIPSGANKDQQSPSVPQMDIEEIEAMLSEQSTDFFKN